MYGTILGTVGDKNKLSIKCGSLLLTNASFGTFSWVNNVKC